MNERRAARERSSSALVAGFCLLAGCGGAVPSPSAPPETPPPAPGVAPAAPAASAEESSAAAPAAPPPAAPAARPSPPSAAAPLEEPLPPLNRAFIPVPMPGVGPLVAVHGRSPQDVWFVASTENEGGEWSPLPRPSGKVIHHDGKRIIGQYTPDCAYHFSGIVVGKDEVLVMGSNMFYRGVAPGLRASLSRQGKWSCGSEGGYSGGRTVATDDSIWTLNCTGMMSDCTLETWRGQRASLPSFDASLGGTEVTISALSMQGPDAGWLTSSDEDGRARLFRYNGVTWVPQAMLDAGLTVVDLWVDEEEHAWIVARRGGKDEDPGDRVLRFDGRALHALPLPASFAAHWVRGTGPRDVWFVGASSRVYQWDGQRLRQGAAPVEVADVWSSRGGEVWVVGPNEAKPGEGMAPRTAPLSEVR